MASSIASFFVSSPPFRPNLEFVRPRPRRVLAKSIPSGESFELKPEERGLEPLIGRGNGHLEELPILWDDEFGSVTLKDYLDAAAEIIRPDGGPPRWFCPVECARSLTSSPILLFLPGLDGTGMGLILHHKSLGRFFEVRCLHIPVRDRTPFEDLVKLVEDIVTLEHDSSPNKPIYLVGESFGGCLALSVAARNPNIDLVLVLVNPATSFGRSQLQTLLPVLKVLPDDFHSAVPYLLSFVWGYPVKMAMVDMDNELPLRLQLQQLSGNLTALLPRLSRLVDIIPKETLHWKLELLKSAAAYANSRLHAVRAEVLILASGKDNMIPTWGEGRRLAKMIRNCKVRRFKDNGHTLLMEEGINLMTVINCTCTYWRSRKHDHIFDFLPPSMSEFKIGFQKLFGAVSYLSSSVLYSTLQDGTIVRGLSGVPSPSEGPVLLVGYHMLLGLELSGIVEGFVREKKALVRGLAHPELFRMIETRTSEFTTVNWMKALGALPVSPTNLFKLLGTNSYALLYPGGAREFLHHKGEEYKCMWPDEPEFVRMAARFGATIVPFGAVGEDDMVQYVLDYNDTMKIPFLNDYIRESSKDSMRVRDGTSGEVADPQQIFIPGLLPKIPGRIYCLFGKPIETRGREKMLKNDKEKAAELYLQIKSEVEINMDYLLDKREEDPYRNIFDRVAYRVLHSPMHDIPGFKP